MVQYSNGANGELRDIFIENGLMVYVTMYHNEIEASAKTKIIYRYLLRKVGELLFYYLWLVVLFWRKLVATMGGRKSDWSSAYIWELMEAKHGDTPVSEEKTSGGTIQGVGDAHIYIATRIDFSCERS